MRAPATIKPDLFAKLEGIETPAVIVDLDVMERNIADYVSFAVEHDISLRSHAKTHKTPDLAHFQQAMTDGDGILCQTLSEAELMAQHGIDDIYLSYMVVEETKLNRLVWLSEKTESFATTVDSRDNINPLREVAKSHDTTIDVILELDVGLGRVGVEPGEKAVELAKYIEETEELNLAGIMAYEAHVALEAETREDFERLCEEVMDRVQTTVSEIEDAGVRVNDVKVGGTSTAKFSGKHPVVTEINPGMYPFNDVGELNRRDFEIGKADCAVTILTTVISTAVDGRAIADAGSKSISLDINELDPVPMNRDDIAYTGASEEHGWIDVSEAECPVEVGEKLEFIVPHVCTTINLHDTLIGVRDGRVEEVWEVGARGLVK